MKSFHSIIAVLRAYLANSKDIKILDKDVAKALGMSQANFATLKRRNSIPYENILEVCKKEELCCLDIFYD